MKTAKDHDLTLAVVGVLTELSHPDPEFWIRGWQEPYATDANYTRIQINQRMRLMLSRIELKLGVNTLTIREAMDNDGDLELWLERFKLITAPFLIKHSVLDPQTT